MFDNSSTAGRSAGERGQTLHDFVLGMTLFLLTLGYVLAFMPSLIAPYVPAEDGSTIVADRTAETLTHDLLAKDDAPVNTLDPYCTKEFFNGSAPSDCPFESSDVQEITGLRDRTNVNVTISYDESVSTYEGVRLARGPAIPENGGDVVTATRIVTLDGGSVKLKVRVW